MTAEARVSTWLVTGASTGIGRSISIAALNAGQRVVGTTRDVAKAQAANPEFASKGGVWLQLDPAHPDSASHFARVQEQHDIDVLVNNAGYAFVGGVEDTSEEEVQDQFEVNFWGPLRAVRAFLPSMRAKGRGNIVLISSGIVYFSFPGRAAYKASKAAIEAVHECLKAEVEAEGIKVLIVEPGSFRTHWTANMKTPIAHESTRGFSEGYKGTIVEKWVAPAHAVKIEEETLPNFIRGDPDKAAKAIVEAVVEGHDYFRLLLGPDCVKAAEGKMEELRSDLDATRQVSMSTDGEMSGSDSKLDVLV
ncbi:hypothetical protein F4802DRAFT_525333 [Xylaria palmicola]|nr:hypothetical protein F4802DRAFT_525333 [Xylaria palmicola]